MLTATIRDQALSHARRELARARTEWDRAETGAERREAGEQLDWWVGKASFLANVPVAIT